MKTTNEGGALVLLDTQDTQKQQRQRHQGIASLNSREKFGAHRLLVGRRRGTEGGTRRAPCWATEVSAAAAAAGAAGPAPAGSRGRIGSLPHPHSAHTPAHTHAHTPHTQTLWRNRWYLGNLDPLQLRTSFLGNLYFWRSPFYFLFGELEEEEEEDGCWWCWEMFFLASFGASRFLVGITTK